jgi:hypothetical protein
MTVLGIKEEMWTFGLLAESAPVGTGDPNWTATLTIGGADSDRLAQKYITTNVIGVLGSRTRASLAIL